MKIVEHKNPNDLVLDPPTFNCDKPLVKRDISPFENKSFFTVYAGCAGAGKTSTVIASLTNKKIYRKAFHNVFIVMPRTSRASLKKDPFQYLKQSNIYDELDYETLLSIYEKITDQTCDEDGNYDNNLLVVDDMTQFLKSNIIQKTLNNLILNRRHLHLSICLMVQYWNSIPLCLRKNVSSVVLCNRPTNKSESDNIIDELLHLDRKKAEALINYTFKKQFDKLFVTIEPLRFYKNMNRLTFDEPE